MTLAIQNAHEKFASNFIDEFPMDFPTFDNNKVLKKANILVTSQFGWVTIMV